MSGQKRLTHSVTIGHQDFSQRTFLRNSQSYLKRRLSFISTHLTLAPIRSLFVLIPLARLKKCRRLIIWYNINYTIKQISKLHSNVII